MQRRSATIVEVNAELQGLIRRLEFQLRSPGGGQALPRCIHNLTSVSLDVDVFTPKPWMQAVSPRFLRRLCKAYTSFDLTVDHQISVLHYRSDVKRSPFQGELYVGDRFKCAPGTACALLLNTGSSQAQQWEQLYFVTWAAGQGVLVACSGNIQKEPASMRPSTQLHWTGSSTLCFQLARQLVALHVPSLMCYTRIQQPSTCLLKTPSIPFVCVLPLSPTHVSGLCTIFHYLAS
jgi:hypothetical protein